MHCSVPILLSVLQSSLKSRTDINSLVSGQFLCPFNMHVINFQRPSRTTPHWCWPPSVGFYSSYLELGGFSRPQLFPPSSHGSSSLPILNPCPAFSFPGTHSYLLKDNWVQALPGASVKLTLLMALSECTIYFKFYDCTNGTLYHRLALSLTTPIISASLNKHLPPRHRQYNHLLA